MSKRAIAFINEDNSIGCTICIESCPFDAIIGAQNFSHRVNYQECPGCKLCVAKCPTDCIEIKIIKEKKEEIKKKITFNFNRKAIRQKNLKKTYDKNIKEQLEKIYDCM